MAENGRVTLSTDADADGAPDASAGAKTASTRQWSSSKHTRQSILDAARSLFSEVGYEAVSINDIVERSGISIGSIYHHVGGKAEIFGAVATQIVDEMGAASKAATTAAAAAGETDPVEIYLAGARAYLLAGWRDRNVSKVMLGDDNPVGFLELHHSLVSRMLAGMRDIVIGDPPVPEASSRAILALLRAGAETLNSVENQELADRVADYYVALVRHLARSR